MNVKRAFWSFLVVTLIPCFGVADSAKLTLNDVRWAGGGCPDEGRGVRASVSPDGNHIELSLPREFALAAGPAPTTVPLKCFITLDIEFPAELKCAVSSVAFDGMAELDEGASVQHFARVWFDRPLNDVVGYYSAVLHGPQGGSYHGASSPLSDARMSWAGCPVGEARARRRLVVDLSLFAQISKAGARAFIRGENSETERRSLDIKWKRCAP